MDPVFAVFVAISVVILIAGIIAFPLWILLHYILCKKLDPLLFREPFFDRSERINYLVWPLSSIRSLNYIGLVAAPGLLKKKRFRGFQGSLPIGPSVRIACKTQLAMLLVLALMFFAYFGYGGFVAIFLS